MIRKRVVIIFPKEDSYKNKSDEYKSQFRRKVGSLLQRYDEFSDMQFYYFNEDWIANEVLDVSNSNYHRLTCYGTMSKMLANKYIGLHEKSVGQSADTSYIDIITEVDKSCQVQLPANVNEENAIKANVQNLLDKRRLVVSKILELEENIILYLDTNNQYCNLKQPSLGDLRLINHVSMKEDTEEFWYSGQYIDKALFFKIIKEMLYYD